MPDLVPVDFDPFAAPQLTPVDHDPFVNSYPTAFDARQQRLARQGLPADPGDKTSDLATRLLGGVVQDAATLGPVRRLMNANAVDTANWGAPPTAAGPAAETAMMLMGGAGAAPAEANSLRAGLATSRTAYKPGEISFGERAPVTERTSAGHEFEDDKGNRWTYDINYAQGGDKTHATVNNLQAVDEEGEPASLNLNRVQQYKLQNDIREDVQGHLEDIVDGANEVLRRRALGPEGRQAEDDAAEWAKVQEDIQRNRNIISVVDAAVARGWRPQVNRFGGWQRPPEFQPFASPSSAAAINARLAHHGISLEPRGSPRLAPVDHDPFAQ